jgi:hypothetical protein
MKYLIVEADGEYNDEYIVMNNGYNITSKLLNTIEEAEELLTKSILELFTTPYGIFKPEIFNFSDYYLRNEEPLRNFLMSLNPLTKDEDYFEMVLPKYATKGQALKAYKISGLKIFSIQKIEE